MDGWVGMESQSYTREFPREHFHLICSVSRSEILAQVYRETDKRSVQQPSAPIPPTDSPPRSSSTTPLHFPTTSQYGESSQAGLMTSACGIETVEPPPVLGVGALHRPRSSSDGGGGVDRQRERQLVGSLTNSYKFKEGGLVKKVNFTPTIWERADKTRRCRLLSTASHNT